jgi:hypothetical protein
MRGSSVNRNLFLCLPRVQIKRIKAWKKMRDEERRRRGEEEGRGKNELMCRRGRI